MWSRDVVNSIMFNGWGEGGEGWLSSPCVTPWGSMHV